MRQTFMPSGAAGSGPFMLTLCSLAAPISIRPPQSPQLKSFKFFVSSARQPDGSESLQLNMGYFATLAEAEQWVQLLRKSYPQAFVTLAPITAQRSTPRQHPPVNNLSLTDTQVLRVLETRRASPDENVVTEESAGISVVRPDDTQVRHALKQAVVQGAPVSFAVQLQWSVQPIDLATVPGVSIFRAYKLYVSQGNREGRTWHCLRLGFFNDAISAKQMGYYLGANFPSVAVVPVTEEESKYAEANPVDLTQLGDPIKLSEAAARDAQVNVRKAGRS